MLFFLFHMNNTQFRPQFIAIISDECFSVLRMTIVAAVCRRQLFGLMTGSQKPKRTREIYQQERIKAKLKTKVATKNGLSNQKYWESRWFFCLMKNNCFWTHSERLKNDISQSIKYRSRGPSKWMLMSSKGLFTRNRSKKKGQKNKWKTTKRIFTFSFAFAECERPINWYRGNYPV